MLDHLERNSILISLYHGFTLAIRVRHSSSPPQVTISICSYISYITANWYSHLWSPQFMTYWPIMIILDFSNVFDTVPHNKLLHKLDQYGINGNTNSWLYDFLSIRQMSVVVDGIESEAANVDSIVPEGTVFRHILPDTVKSTLLLFADDFLLYRATKTRADHHKLQQDRNKLEEWASTWGMRFNTKKCFILSINKK